MGKYVFFVLYLILYIVASCDNMDKKGLSQHSVTAQENTTKEVLKDTIQKELEPLPQPERIYRQIDVLKDTTDGDTDRANFYKWEGSIDNKYPITLIFECDERSFSTHKNTTDTISVSGSYTYKNHNKPIVLEGEWYPAHSFIRLKVYKDSVVDEIFEGQFLSSFLPIKGKWTKIATGKTLPFVLNNTVDEKTTKIFANYLENSFYEESVEGVTAKGAGVDDFGIYMKEVGGWGISWTLSSYFFISSTDYVSGARSSGEKDISVLINIPDTEVLLVWNIWGEDGYTKDVDGNPEEYHESNSSYVYIYDSEEEDFLEIAHYHDEDGVVKEEREEAYPERDIRVRIQKDSLLVTQKSTKKTWIFLQDKEVKRLLNW